MTKIIAFNVRTSEEKLVEDWAKTHQVQVDIASEPLSLETVEQVKKYDGLTLAIGKALDPEIYTLLHQYGIKQIAQRSAGYEYFDLDLASKNDLIITNVPSYSPESIAEFAFLTALALVREFPLINQRVNNHDFRWLPDIRGKVLKEMTVGIIGTGHIGQATAQCFKGFGCHVIGYDLYQNDEAKTLLDYRENMADVLADADIISLHMPATRENYHLFDAEAFKQFKTGAYLINTARGSLVETTALLDALDKGQLAGAALDTYEGEGQFIGKTIEDQAIEDPTFERLLAHPKVLYTPHVAYYTDIAVTNIMHNALDAVMEVIQTGDSKSRVN